MSETPNTQATPGTPAAVTLAEPGTPSAGADVLGAVCESPGAQAEHTLRGGYGDLFGAFNQQRAGVGHHVEGADSVAFSELGGDAQGFGAELFSLRLNRLDQGVR